MSTDLIQQARPPRERTHGIYYATAISTRADGKRFGHEVARQARTFEQARAALDSARLPGYVQVWSERQQQRFISAERRANGSWFSTDPFTGEQVDLAKEATR